MWLLITLSSKFCRSTLPASNGRTTQGSFCQTCVVLVDSGSISRTIWRIFWRKSVMTETPGKLFVLCWAQTMVDVVTVRITTECKWGSGWPKLRRTVVNFCMVYHKSEQCLDHYYLTTIIIIWLNEQKTRLNSDYFYTKNQPYLRECQNKGRFPKKKISEIFH